MDKSQVFFLAFAAIALFTYGCVSNLPGLPPMPGTNKTPPTQIKTPPTAADNAELKSFKSWDEISLFLKSSGSNYGGYGRGGIMMMEATKDASGAPAPSVPQSAGDYSQTNVQVSGVDEADTVKNDGKYIYVIGQTSYNYYGYGGDSATGKILIIDAFPASSMKQVAEIDVNGTPQQLFIYKDKLVVFGTTYRQNVMPMAKIACIDCRMPPYYSESFTFMKIYDITDRSSPALVKEISVKGNYVNSRMIDGKVYGIFQDYAGPEYPVPLYQVDGVTREIAPNEIRYFDWPDEGYNYNIFTGVDLNDLSKQESRKIILMGYTQNLFVSSENMYITYTRYNTYLPLWGAYEKVYFPYLSEEVKGKISSIDKLSISDWRKDNLKVSEAQQYIYGGETQLSDEKQQELYTALSEEIGKLQQAHYADTEKTVINKISLQGFSYLGKGEVKGHVLNQFSMDEKDGNFRVATTVSERGGFDIWMGPTRRPVQAIPSESNMYVLDSNLKVIGTLEGLAPGEQIYSVRFMGDRAYRVTYKRIDPLFVIDLSNPSSPQLLGKLKIPGYSDYLHPYDENYIIGIGKDSVDSKEGDFGLYQGLKLALFDVRDPSNPIEVAKMSIGDRGTDSNALHDHKAFLFSKAKNLLVIPVLEAKINPAKYPQGVDQWAYGDYVFQGAYVFSLTPEKGFTLRGRITHATEEEMNKSGEYFWSSAQVSRSLYMDNYLYTISDRYIKANELTGFESISSVKIGEDQPPYPVMYAAGSGGVAVSSPPAPSTAPSPPPPAQ